MLRKLKLSHKFRFNIGEACESSISVWVWGMSNGIKSLSPELCEIAICRLADLAGQEVGAKLRKNLQSLCKERTLISKPLRAIS